MKAWFSIRTAIALKSRFKIKRMCVAWALAALATRAACADDTEQAQATQFGIYFGGMASQYDLCVDKGFLPKGDRSAEALAASILAKMRELSKGPDQSSYVQQGWDLIKQEIAKHASDYTREKCSWVGTEWQKMVKTMTPK
jgi:opacity protein-like surface antigen